MLISTDVVDYTTVGDSLYVWTEGDLVRVRQDRSTEIAYDNDAPGPNSGLYFSYMFEMDGDLWVRASSANYYDFYRYDPGAGTFSQMNVAHNSGGDSLYFRYGDVGDSQFFGWLFDSTYGRELSVSDGTTGSFSLVMDINPGSGSSYVGNSPSATLGNTLIFVADDGGAERRRIVGVGWNVRRHICSDRHRDTLWGLEFVRGTIHCCGGAYSSVELQAPGGIFMSRMELLQVHG